MAGVVIVLQARMASSRLPGKALESLGPHSVLFHCLTRLRQCRLGTVALATTNGSEDDLLEFEAARCGVTAYRGSTVDVLSRFAAVAAASGAEYVVRALGSNPAVDSAAVGRLLTALRAAGADYAVEDGLPHGAGVEVMTAAALRRCAEHAWGAGDREQVTAFMRRPGTGFRTVVATAPPALCRPDLRFTIGTRSDLHYMRDVVARAAWGSEAPQPLDRLIAAADALARFREVA